MRYLLTVLLSISLLACENRKLEADPMDEGFQLIDQERYDEAIVFFQNLSKDDPRPDVRIGLATAYVGRARVTLPDYWNFVKAMRADPITDERVEQNDVYTESKAQVAPLEPVLPAEVNEDLTQVFKMVSALDLYRARVEIVPYVPREKRPDIEMGIDTLNQINNAGGRLYRAVLVGTLLRSELDDGFDVWQDIESKLQNALSQPLENLDVFCTPLTGDYTAWVEERFFYIQSASNDLAYAFPSDADDFLAYEDTISGLAQNIPDIQSTLVPGGCQ